MIRARIHRAYAHTVPHDLGYPYPVPVGWDYSVYDTTTRCTLITGATLTHSHALRDACRHIRLATELSNIQPLTH